MASHRSSLDARWRTIGGSTVVLLAAMAANNTTALELPIVQFASGDVTGLAPDGAVRTLGKGDVLKPGERVQTGANGMVQVRSEGAGVVALRSNTDVAITPGEKGLEVRLNSGQIRTVTDLVRSAGVVTVVTPKASVAVNQSDVVTGVLPPRPGSTEGETFNSVNAGSAELAVGNEPPVVIEAGNARLLTASGAQTIDRAQLQDVTEFEPLPDPGTTTLPPPVAALPVLPSRTLPATVAPQLPTGVFDVKGVPVASGMLPAAALPPEQARLPDVKFAVTTLQVQNGSGVVNEALAAVPVVTAGRAGSGDQTLTLVNSAVVTGTKSTSVTMLTQTLQQGAGGQPVPVLEAGAATPIVNAGVQSSALVLQQATVVAPPTQPVAVTNIGVTTLNSVDPTKAVNALQPAGTLPSTRNFSIGTFNTRRF